MSKILNLTNLQGLYYYTKHFINGEKKLNNMEGLKNDVENNKYKNEYSKTYIIQQPSASEKIELLAIDNENKNGLELKNGVLIENKVISIIKDYAVTDTYKIIKRDTFLNLLKRECKEKVKIEFYKEKIYFYNNMKKILYKWYKLEDAKKIFNEYLKVGKKLLYKINKKGYLYFYNYIDINNIDPEVVLSKDIFNIEYIPCVLITDNGEDLVICDDIVEKNESIIELEFNKFKNKIIDNKNLDYKILA